MFKFDTVEFYFVFSPSACMHLVPNACSISASWMQVVPLPILVSSAKDERAHWARSICLLVEVRRSGVLKWTLAVLHLLRRMAGTGQSFISSNPLFPVCQEWMQPDSYIVYCPPNANKLWTLCNSKPWSTLSKILAKLNYITSTLSPVSNCCSIRPRSGFSLFSF